MIAIIKTFLLSDPFFQNFAGIQVILSNPSGRRVLYNIATEECFAHGLEGGNALTSRVIRNKLILTITAVSLLICGLTIQTKPVLAAQQNSSSGVVNNLKKTRNSSGWLVNIYASAAKNFKTKKVSVTERVVNVRSGPGTSYAKVASVKKGQSFSVVSQSGDWYKINLGDGKTGWVASWLVNVTSGSGSNQGTGKAPQPQSGSGTVGVPVTGKYMIIKESIVNVRSGPGIQYGVVQKVKYGEKYIISRQSSDWYQVILPNQKSGWVAGWLAEIRSSATSSRGDSGDVGIPDQNNSGSVIKLTGIDMAVTGNDGDSLVINADGAINFDTTYMKDPNRLVIDIKNSDVNGLTDIAGNGRFISGVRVAQYSKSPMMVRVVVDLNSAASFATALSQDSRSLTVTISEASIKNKTIVIDAGHGGYDPGAMGVTGLKEKDYNLAAALLLKDKLAALGANVILTRSDDTFISLTERCEIANNAGADIFVAIHANSSTSPSLRGTATYYYAPSSNPSLYAQLEKRKRLAQDVQTKLIDQLGTRNIGILQENFAVLRGTKMPSILVESAFLSNSDDEAILKDSAMREKIAEALAEGITQYFSS